jgi:hypothetical protein
MVRAGDRGATLSLARLWSDALPANAIAAFVGNAPSVSLTVPICPPHLPEQIPGEGGELHPGEAG